VLGFRHLDRVGSTILRQIAEEDEVLAGCDLRRQLGIGLLPAIAARRLDLLVDDAELERRRAGFRAPPLPGRGWHRLHVQTVLQANLGADLSFLSAPAASGPTRSAAGGLGATPR